MAHLDLDTTALAAGGARARAAVSALAASPVVGGTDDASTLAVAGDPVLAVEAMKMEHVLLAPTDGAVRLHVTTGQTVRRGERLAQVVPAGGEHG